MNLVAHLHQQGQRLANASCNHPFVEHGAKSEQSSVRAAAAAGRNSLAQLSRGATALLLAAKDAVWRFERAAWGVNRPSPLTRCAEDGHFARRQAPAC